MNFVDNHDRLSILDYDYGTLHHLGNIPYVQSLSVCYNEVNRERDKPSPIDMEARPMSEEGTIWDTPLPRKEYNLKGCHEHENSTQRIRDFVSQALPTFTNKLVNIHVICNECGFSCGYGENGMMYETMTVGGKAWASEMARIDQLLIDDGIITRPSDEL